MLQHAQTSQRFPDFSSFHCVCRSQSTARCESVRRVRNKPLLQLMTWSCWILPPVALQAMRTKLKRCSWLLRIQNWKWSNVLSSWDLINAQTVLTKCQRKPAMLTGICCTVQMVWAGFWLPFFLFWRSWVLTNHSGELWYAEVLEAQDIRRQFLGNCCGFAQVEQRCIRGLLTEKWKAHFQSFFFFFLA